MPPMIGQLRDHPLAELINEISTSRLSGALRLAHERVKGAVYFEAGRVVAALSNLRISRLGEFLRRGGAVSAERLEALIREGMTDEQVAEAVLSAGLLSPDELKREQGRQATEVLRLLLQWTEGEWSFDARVRLAPPTHVQVTSTQLLIETARSFPNEYVAGRMENLDEMISPVPDVQAASESGDVRLEPAEAFVLSRVESPLTMGELLAVSGLPEPETRRAIYALALAGLLARQHWPRALAGAKPAPPSTASAPKPAAAEAPAAHAQAANTSEASSPRAVAASEAEAPARAAQAPAEATPERDARVEVDALLAQSNGATHYEVLGVARSAKPDDIKRVYYAHARRFHPDRFRRDVDEATMKRVEIAFARIAQAYEVLKDSKLRASYDLKLRANPEQATQNPAPGAKQPAAKTGETEGSASGEDKAHASARPAARASAPESAASYRAEEKFQLGLAALQQNNLVAATKYLGEAALIVPNQARYRAYYGRALAQGKQTRRQAEMELQAAITLDRQNASYHVMLAELYRDLGLKRRAETELERALVIDPRHVTARRLLSALRSTS